MIALSVVFAAAGVSAIAVAAVRGRSARPVPWSMPYVAPIPERARMVLAKPSHVWEHGPDRCVLHMIG